MPIKNELKKIGKEINRVVDQVTTETKKFTNDHDNNVQNIKDLLSSLGINHENREEFDIGFPHPLNPLNEQEPIKYRWIASTSLAGDGNQEKGEQAKLVLKSLLEAKRSNEVNDVTPEFKDHFSKLNPSGVVAFMNTAKNLSINTDGCVGAALQNMENYPAKWDDVSTKELFTKYNVTNPYCPFEDKIEQNTQNHQEVQQSIPSVDPKAFSSEESLKKEVKNVNTDTTTTSSLETSKGLLAEKVKLTNGKEVEVKKIMGLIYNETELDYYLKMLPSEVSQIMKNEITLKLAYDFYKDHKEFAETKAISERIGTIDNFETYTSFNIDQLKDEEVAITGGTYSYLE